MRLEKVSTNYKDEDDGIYITITCKVRRGGRKGGPRRGHKGNEEEYDSSF
jgi:hypothetical protein